ncbi:carbohydrate-binding protein [Hymenobacter terrenus]|uniref:carbohydrate-binding protein n=1 Tax=Hymenobacter terrenus TaxID=1629124 RepID=UPI0006196BB2|nr:carbohydrate-binding protein [Hymenobacter terrenus]
MKNFFTTLACALSLTALSSVAAHAQTYQQVWSDEFTNGISSSWQFDTGGGGWGNNEKQYYQVANATVVNGELQITARRENVGGLPYTSARLKTQGIKEFTYGKVEARIKLPLGQGLWPAFWMLGGNISSVGWPRCGEIDVMEQINTDSRTYGTLHWDNNGHAEYGSNTPTAPNVYHVYGIEWDANAIRWYLDGVQFHETSIANGVGGTEEFQKPFFLLLNLAVAGNWPGQAVDESKLPATMFVDYVRVYQKTNTPPPPSTAVLLQAEAASLNNGMIVEGCSDTGGGQNVGYVDAGDYLVFNNINFPTSGTYNIEYRVASGANGGTISADLNAGTIPLGNTTIPATGGWQNWTTVSKTVNVDAGTYNFGIFAQTNGWNLNWIRITKVGARTATSVADKALSAQLYPNPVTNQLNITSDVDLAGGHYQIMDGHGKVVASGATTDGYPGIAELKSGPYMLIIITKNNQKITRRFSK